MFPCRSAEFQADGSWITLVFMTLNRKVKKKLKINGEGAASSRLTWTPRLSSEDGGAGTK